ncbi:YlbF family regulator [Streptococcus dentiloxodontae]
MLSINEEFLAIDQSLDKIVKAFLDLPEAINYKQKRQLFLTNAELQERIQDFQALKEDFEAQESYAAFRSEVHQLKRQLLMKKRQIDMNETVIAYRQAETSVQKILAQISQELAQAISAQIFVDTGLPLAPHKPPHKKGRGNNIKENMDVK